MHNQLRIVFLSSFVAYAPPLFAQSQTDREFARLQEQKETAIAAAIEPVNRNYQAELEKLLRRATQAGDLQTANKIDLELKNIELTSASSPDAKVSAEDFAALLVDSKWIWWGVETLSFLPDGKAKWSHSPVLWEWKVTSSSKRVIEGKNMYKHGDKFKITFDKDLKTGTIEDDGEEATRKTQRVNE